MPFLDTLKSIINLSPSSPSMKVVTINSSVNYEELPKGFFNVETMSGKKSLGFNGGFLSWRVGSVVVDGAKRISAPENRDELPTVRLNFQRPACDGVQHVAGCSVIDTDSLEGDSSVVWDGEKPSSGVGWR
jgi:hypothetical protein